MYKVLKIGVKVDPPTLIVTYTDKSTYKYRYRSMPVRNFRKNSNVRDTAEEIKKNQRHRNLLSNVSLVKLEKNLLIIQNYMNGHSLKESIEKANNEMTIDPNNDLNKVEPSEVVKAKRIMNDKFEKVQIKPEDENFQYDVQVDFGGSALKTSVWDSSDEDDDYNDDF